MLALVTFLNNNLLKLPNNYKMYALNNETLSFKALKTKWYSFNCNHSGVFCCWHALEDSRMVAAQFLFPSMIRMESAAALEGQSPVPAAQHLGRQFWLFQSDTQHPHSAITCRCSQWHSPQSSPPSRLPILSLHSFRRFSCLSGAVTGSSSFAQLISADLISPSSCNASSLHLILIVFVLNIFVIVDYCWFLVWSATCNRFKHFAFKVHSLFRVLLLQTKTYRGQYISASHNLRSCLIIIMFDVFIGVLIQMLFSHLYENSNCRL